MVGVCHSVLNATTGSLLAATFEGINPAINVKIMLIITNEIASPIFNAARLGICAKLITISFAGILIKYVNNAPITPAVKPIINTSALNTRLISFFLAPKLRKTPISFVLSTTDTYVIIPIITLDTINEIDANTTNTILIASISSFPTIMGERISLKIYKPPVALDKIITDEKQRNILLSAIEKPGIILVCGSPLSGKTHIIYPLLMGTTNLNKNIMTIESIAKYELLHINQCELNENIGFNMDKALRFVEFQSPDVIYLEGIKTREAFEFLSELYYNDKTVVTEFMANSMTDLRQKLAFDDFQSFKSLVSCLVFIHSRDSIEVFDKSTLQKYLA